jgi:transposase
MTKREIKLVKNLSKRLKQLNQREYLHRFGPKKFKFVHHVLALLMKESLKLSFRRISWLLEEFEIKVPTYSALCKSRKRIPLNLWNSLLTLTAGVDHKLVAIDGTGFSRTNPSFHYVKRIDRDKPVKSFAKLSALFDIVKKKFTALRIRIKPRHDMKDVNYLMKASPPMEKLLGDSAYDAESLHEKCYWKKIKLVVKPKKNARKGWARKISRKDYCEKEYHQRSLIESGFGSLKRKYGGSVSGKKLVSVRAEVYCKAICHNLNLTLT